MTIVKDIFDAVKEMLGRDSKAKLENYDLQLKKQKEAEEKLPKALIRLEAAAAQIYSLLFPKKFKELSTTSADPFPFVGQLSKFPKKGSGNADNDFFSHAIRRHHSKNPNKQVFALIYSYLDLWDATEKTFAGGTGIPLVDVKEFQAVADLFKSQVGKT